MVNGVAKIWHGLLRIRPLAKPFSPGMMPLSSGVVRSPGWIRGCRVPGSSGGSAVLFIDVQAAYYEVSRQLIFPGEALGLEDAPPSEEWHLAALADSLARQGALELLGISRAERALLKDCVACSFWHLSGSSSVFRRFSGITTG